MDRESQFIIRTPEYLESFEPFRDATSINHIAGIIQSEIEQKGSNLRCLDSMAGTGIVGRKMKELFQDLQIVYQDGGKKMLSSDVYEDEERVLADSKALSIKPGVFDIIFCRGGLNNVSKEDYQKILAEYMRVLQDDGIGIVQDHFGATKREKDVVNRIESAICDMEKRSDKTYVPTDEDLMDLIHETGGYVFDEQYFEKSFSLKDRFASKNINNPDMSAIKVILKNQSVIKYEETEDDIIVTYPIVTICFKKQPRSAKTIRKDIGEVLSADK